ncbi:MAG: ATP-binding protein [Ignavibacteriales bacterium]|nr:ATP-binding protein [Ignavibacteriales bacterium]
MITKIKLFFTSTRFKITIWYSSLFFLMEFLLGMVIYFYIYSISHMNLDSSLKTQANSILRVIEEKHVDLDSFQPSTVYKSEDELIWDIAYDAIVFNRRNTFIEVTTSNRIIFKTANLGKITLSFPDKKEKAALFDYKNIDLSEGVVRVCQLKSKKYVVIVAYSKEYISQTLSNLKEIYILIAPIFFLISIVGGALISAKSLSRIDAIIRKTEEITGQNLDETIPGGEYFDEYGRLVKKMNEMVGRIKTSVDFMNQFSISAAHELKTPLTILRGEIEIALKSEKTPQQYIEVLKSNFEETIRMIKIIDNLFFISKSDNAMINIDYQEVELKSFLSSLSKSLGILGQEKNMSLVLEDLPNLYIQIDINLMKQALSNIIDNAFKFGDENTDVTISAIDLGEEIKICITNTGERIPAEEVEKIFDRFYRADISRTRKTGGVGLGLSVVKSIVNLHKGTVEVQTTNNSLTKLIIYLPKI